MPVGGRLRRRQHRALGDRRHLRCRPGRHRSHGARLRQQLHAGRAHRRGRTIVIWNWQGNAQHNVVGDGFESDTQVNGTFEHGFDSPGTYTYVCTLHPGMDGTVIAVDA